MTTKKGAKVPKGKLYSLHLPIPHIAQVHYYSALEFRTPADFMREAIRQYLNKMRASHGDIPTIELDNLVDAINAGGRISDNGTNYREHAAKRASTT